MLKTCIGQSVCESVFQSVPRFSHVRFLSDLVTSLKGHNASMEAVQCRIISLALWQMQ